MGIDACQFCVKLSAKNKMRRHRKSGKSHRAIADYLNQHSYPTKRNGIWSHRTVKQILDQTKTDSV
jgi:hypothetical protein